MKSENIKIFDSITHLPIINEKAFIIYFKNKKEPILMEVETNDVGSVVKQELEYKVIVRERMKCFREETLNHMMICVGVNEKNKSLIDMKDPVKIHKCSEIFMKYFYEYPEEQIDDKALFYHWAYINICNSHLGQVKEALKQMKYNNKYESFISSWSKKNDKTRNV